MRILFASVLCFAGYQAIAADIAHEVTSSSDRNETYGEISLMFQSAKIPLVGINDQSIEDSTDTNYSLHINLQGRIQYKRFFVEAVRDSFNNVTFGYNLIQSERVDLAIIGTNLFEDIERDSIEGLESIEDRDGDFNLGIRTSLYHDDLVAQLELLSDVSDSHDGIIGALHIGKQQQIRNWNLHGLVGVRFFSDDVVDHLFGVSSSEATASIPIYQADSGLMPSVQLGATLPLNEKWIFTAQAEYSALPDSVVDSPLSQGDSLQEFQIGVSYIIGG